MRKYFEGHSFIGGALILSVTILGLFLRFYDLSALGPWTDELASWWYLRHLDEVFFRESHSPLYYGLIRFFLGGNASISEIRTFTAAVSALHLVEFFFLGQRVFTKKKFLVFWILICLNPADIVYARMARHYAWLLEGMIVYLLLIQGDFPRWMRQATAAFMGFIHIFFIVPMGILSLYQFFRTKNLKALASDLLTALPVLIYYIVRISIHGHDKVISNVSWNHDHIFHFLERTINQFLGEAYPHSVFFPVNFWMALPLVGFTFFWIIWKKKNSGLELILVTVGTIVIIEVLSFCLNLRQSRYAIYLISFWIIALADSSPEEGFRGAWVTLVGSLLVLQLANPLVFYHWEREKVAEWKEFQKEYAVSQQLVCSNIYQSDYYDLKAGTLCREDFLRLDKERPILYFDLNGNDSHLFVRLIKEMDVIDYRVMKFGVIALLKPRGKDGKSKK